ncbi:ssu-2 homolog, tandem duplicate 2 isoform X1 [Megalops cyprinoides]|uniref:ssu-2 homolog, tandem duplicate 2 isoform X1 n=1 Tax=Megalops cyprinoides TaxID=118141 RepID=UPI00186401D5|nr:ssu-2 homolog, tandem duplicate 2 isoform X1 [Megalops cyprinoides]
MDRQHLLSDQDDPSASSASTQQYPVVAGADAMGSSQPMDSGATAPPADLMDRVPGYEGMGSGGNDLPPPYPEPPQPEGPKPMSPNREWQIPSISEELAMEALLEYVSSKCCYSKKPVQEMIFSDLQSHNTFRYSLETFTESRSTEWASVPYTGQVVDGHMGAAPGPWDIAVPVPAIFQDNTKQVQIPYTSSVKGCHSCLTLGRSPCRRCVTSGMMQCSMCNGVGRLSDSRCMSCNGAGRLRCTFCSGRGSTTCKTCKGKGQLLCFIKLTVKWKNNLFQFVVDKQSGLPVDHLSQVTGETLFSDMQPLVYPVVNFPDNAINQVSEKAVRQHQAKFFSTCRILQQRQTIELIPITRVHYTWKEKTHIYFVYGAEHRVYTNDYPAKCCCCNIL